MPSSGVKTCADRKSTRLNSSHLVISYAVFCLKKTQSARSFASVFIAAAAFCAAALVLCGGGCRLDFGLHDGRLGFGLGPSFLSFFFFLNGGDPRSFPLFPPSALPG